MIYELRTYTIKAGMHPAVVKNSDEVGRPIRGDDYGKLEGYWATEIGQLSQVVHLWSYESYDERQRLRKALAENKAWTGEYLPLIRPNLIRQEIKLMEAFLPLKAPPGEGNVYELRCYRTLPGRVREWAGLFSGVMPAREKYSPNVGAWIVDAGQPNQACHLWAYRDLNHRAAVRAESGTDPDWQGFLKASVPLLDEMHSTIMLPAAHSPLQ